MERFLDVSKRNEYRTIDTLITGLFLAESEGVLQGRVLTTQLSNIMLNEFNQYLYEHYLSGKARKDRWY